MRDISRRKKTIKKRSMDKNNDTIYRKKKFIFSVKNGLRTYIFTLIKTDKT